MTSYQGTNFSQEEFFKKQEDIAVEISPKDPNLRPLLSFSGISGMHRILAGNIAHAGYKHPTPVQKWGIPLLLQGKDVMACAQTGSGKTAFFLFPAINYLLSQGSRGGDPNPSVLVMAPTRELCVQIHEEAAKFIYDSPIKAGVVYGGTEMKHSFSQLRNGIDVLVATPGRLQDLIDRNAVGMRSIQTLILDEADRMLDMGFEPQIRKIVEKSGMPRGHNRQTVMTSATFSAEVQHMASDFMGNYVFIAIGRVGGAVSTILQRVVWVEDEEKESYVLGLLLHQRKLGLTLVFVNTKQGAVDLERFLNKVGIKAGSIHGDRTQAQREAALEQFKNQSLQILVATDVAARGLDIPNVALVIQYDMSMSIDDYVHRIGRTGRIGKSGISIAFVNNRNKGMASDLIAVLNDAKMDVPAFLKGMAISTGNYDANATAQQTYGGQDVRTTMKKGFMTAEQKAEARRFGDFDKDAYGEGCADKAQEVAATVGPSAPGSYEASTGKGKGKGKKGGKKSGKDASGGAFESQPWDNVGAQLGLKALPGSKAALKQDALHEHGQAPPPPPPMRLLPHQQRGGFAGSYGQQNGGYYQ